ncbi:hypothetical protein [uncultured Mediterranean phage uvMED]|nr:hypothetical protein [uncultured Mediterranean phage uvMED]
MAYTTIDKPSDYFNTKLYTGTGSSNSISGIGFAPDWVWIKNRGLSGHHMLFDKVRGATKALYSNLTDAETTVSGHLTSFDSDGFTLGDNSGKGSTNGNTETYASWNWLGANGTASNTDGSITSTVSANTTSGFSIVSYTGTGSNATVGHGLGANMDFAIFKLRSGSSAWLVYHKSLGATKAIYLNETGAVGTNSSGFNDTEPTSSVFSLGSGATANTSGGTQIAYCFAEKKGYSKFGSYTGNGSTNGTFIYTGFKPAFVIYKRYDSGSYSWVLVDNKRNTFNAVDKYVHPNLSATEGTVTLMDFLSNGFKMRVNDVTSNQGSIIYMAFAENPFVTSTGIPSCAR